MSLAALRAVGAPAVLRGIKASGGRWLRQLESVEVERRVGLGVALHRASLIDILLGRLTRTQVHLGADVTTVDLNGTVHWTTQRGDDMLHADLVAAADGMASSVRDQHWGVEPRPARVMCLRAVVDVPTSEFIEMWGRGENVGHVPIGVATPMCMPRGGPRGMAPISCGLAGGPAWSQGCSKPSTPHRPSGMSVSSRACPWRGSGSRDASPCSVMRRTR